MKFSEGEELLSFELRKVTLGAFVQGDHFFNTKRPRPSHLCNGLCWWDVVRGPVCVGQNVGCSAGHTASGRAMLRMFPAVCSNQLAHACVRDVPAFCAAHDQRVILQSAPCLSSHHL